MIALGVARATDYSPGVHARNDRLLFESTGAALASRGWRVDLVNETELGGSLPDTPYVFSMCQGPLATRRLRDLEVEGRLIINSPRAVESCYRVRLFSQLSADALATWPETQIVRTSGRLRRIAWLGSCPAWVKRGDVHSTCADDVQQVPDPAALRRVLDGFRRRGIRTAIVQRHVAGTLTKFYGVRGTDFFRWHSEGAPPSSPTAMIQAQAQIHRLVSRIGLDVYGGDCVVAPDGRFWLIDLNDWPSFASFRSEASAVIAQHLARRFEAHAATRRRPLVSALGLSLADPPHRTVHHSTDGSHTARPSPLPDGGRSVASGGGAP